MGTKTLPAQRANKEPFVAEQMLPRQDAKNILRWPQKEQEKTATPLKPERWALFLSVYLSGYNSRWQICLFFFPINPNEILMFLFKLHYFS
ncbi:hypothetical protein [Paenibacillus sp. PL91]|uniref:hypothetical protein n=1 Tax=Paenibacillus sp. PL91 TaxID=2729538 RepID=UPI00145CD570|nr:hypothetical protein [Paenibacillus sp. PL91]MBC9204675.1 hypothetical protein [Paenibacillus sp. PL91]